MENGTYACTPAAVNVIAALSLRGLPAQDQARRRELLEQPIAAASGNGARVVDGNERCVVRRRPDDDAAEEA